MFKFTFSFRSANQSVNQSVNPSVNQSFNLSVNQSVAIRHASSTSATVTKSLLPWLKWVGTFSYPVTITLARLCCHLQLLGYNYLGQIGSLPSVILLRLPWLNWVATFSYSVTIGPLPVS